MGKALFRQILNAEYVCGFVCAETVLLQGLLVPTRRRKIKLHVLRVARMRTLRSMTFLRK